jgi:hypothetical protein
MARGCWPQGLLILAIAASIIRVYRATLETLALFNSLLKKAHSTATLI